MSEQPESVAHLARQLRRALETADLPAFGELLDPDVRWGPPGDPSPPCRSRAQVLSWYGRSRSKGASAKVTEVSVVGDRILVGLVVTGTPAARERGGRATRWQVFTARRGRVVEIVGFEQRRQALTHAGVVPDGPTDRPLTG